MSDHILFTKSISGKNWDLYNSCFRNVSTIMQKFSVPEIIARIVDAKNIQLNQIEDFFSPTLRNLTPDPFHLLDMDKACKRIIKAIKKKEHIAIFGDYDVDGATSSSLLKRFFNDIGQKCEIYIPDRIKEGYGPNITALRKLKDNGAKIIITVDCGTLAHKVLEEITKEGVDVIVLDHHLSAQKLPDILAIVNPNRLDEKSPYKYLAAVGVCYLFIIGVNSLLKLPENENLVTKLPNLLSYLDLVSLGTVCDVVPLVGFNRALVAQGLKIFALSQNQGIRALIDITKIEEKVGAYHLGYIIGPRINAGGRVGTSDYGARLLATNDCEFATKIAAELENFNKERKTIELIVLQQAELIYQKEKDNNKLIIVHGDNWHHGVIGIVASRLKEKYNLPAIVISFDDNGYGKASGRSIANFDIGTKIVNAKQQDILLDGGGHAMAAGFSIMKDQLDDFRKFMNDSFTKFLAGKKEKTINYFDGYLDIDSLNIEFANIIEKFAPFGQGNSEPIFALRNLLAHNIKIIGNNHLKILVGNSRLKNGKMINLTAFRVLDTAIGDFFLNNNKTSFTAIGKVKINRWQGRENIDFLLEDIIIENI